MKIFFYGLILFLITDPGFSQANTEWIWRPEYTYSWRASDRLAYTAKISLFNSVNDLDNRSAILNVQPQVLFKYRFIPLLKIGGGFVYRRSTPFLSEYYYEFKTLQELGSINNNTRRIAHRLQAEQRFRSPSYQNRIRYRFSYDLPLNGKTLEPGERYLIFSNELLSVFNKSEADAENRFYAGMGWFYTRHQKFEFAFQYRTLKIFNGGGIIHRFMLSTSFYTNR